MGPPEVIPGAHVIILVMRHCWWLSQSDAMSISGKLSGQFMNLAALPMGLGFNSHSSEGCLGLKSPNITSFGSTTHLILNNC